MAHQDPAAHTLPLRAFALLASIAALWTLACRPAWSPDGRRVTFAAKVGDDYVVARHELGSGKAEVLLRPPGSTASPVTVAFRDDKPEWVVMSRAAEKELVVTRVAMAGAVLGSHTFTIDDDAINQMITGPVVVGGALFVGGTNPLWIDLDSGKVTAKVQVDDSGRDGLIVSQRGDGVGYGRKITARCRVHEIGTLDPKTLERTPLFRTELADGWRVDPHPTFAPGLARCALPASCHDDQGELVEAAILIYHDDQLEKTLSVASGEAVVGALAWSHDGEIVYALLAHRKRGVETVSMLEIARTGASRRETQVCRHRIGPAPDSNTPPKPRYFIPTAAPLSVSPDGRWLALSTAYVEDLELDRTGLLLVDLEHDQRAITVVPFPSTK